MARLHGVAEPGGTTPPDHTPGHPETVPVRLWDPLVRITHWGVALAVVSNGLLNEEGGTAHVWIGWAMMALLALRLMWGVIGPAEARFSAFPPDPRAGLSHLADLVRGLKTGARPRAYGSHNPAGALMAYALWGLLAVVAATGLVMTGGATPIRLAEEKAAVAAGDWSALAKPGAEAHTESAVTDIAEEVHEVAANLLLILALLHVAGVVVESRALRRNLVRPMLLGSRKP